MKITSAKLKIALFIGATAILAIFVTRPGYSQESARKESQKKIVLKVVSDDNGKTTVIDTTMELPDTAMMDSINESIEKIIVMGNGGKHARFKVHNMRQGFKYNFEIPTPPECPMDIEDFENIEMEGMVPGQDMDECMWERMAPGPERRVMRLGGHRQTLTDVLGDIPMDRVVSYSIKDRKNGKRIIIDLNDAPMFERQDRVIVIREPGRMSHNRNRPERQVKVIVNSEDDPKQETVTELPETPAPPPPPPPAPKPEKSSAKKPKI